MSPHKKTPSTKKYHPLRVPKELETRLKERAKRFKSINAYVLHAIELELNHSDACAACSDRAIAESVRTTIRLTKMAEGSG